MNYLDPIKGGYKGAPKFPTFNLYETLLYFYNKTSDYKYCKQFWSLKKKNKLDEGVYWDNQGLNAISVYSTQEITEQETKTLKRLGIA